MADRKWNHAAWMAIGAAALTPPNVLLSIIVDGPLKGSDIALPMTLLAVLIGTTAAALAIIATYRFRELLNERYDYHGIDTLVTFLIFAVSALVLVSVVGRVSLALMGGRSEQATFVALMFVAPMMLLGVATGIVSIIAGVKLFGLENDLQHLIRPYAVMSIIGGACFTTVILAPIGMLILVAENIILALTFFRAGESEPTVEFV